jgi:hypothetical protein
MRTINYIFDLNLERYAYPEHIEHMLQRVRLTVFLLWWYQYGGGQIQKSQTTVVKVGSKSALPKTANAMLTTFNVTVRVM